MKSIRIGNDIRIEWPIELGEGIEGLGGLDLSVWVRPSAPTVNWHNYVEHPTVYRHERTAMMNGGLGCLPPGDMGDGREYCRPHERPPHGRPPHAGAPARLPFKVEGNKIIAYWRADRQFAVGDYDIILYARKDRTGQGVCDQYRFVRLVAYSAQADLPCGEGGLEAVVAMQPVTLELSGLSAYEIAVIHGFKGTEEEWIESLKPDDAAAEDYREKFMDTGINDTMPSDLLTTVVGVTQGEDTVTIELDGVHRGSSDGYQPIESGEGEIGLPAATRDKAGVMTAADKKTLDGLNTFGADGIVYYDDAKFGFGTVVPAGGDGEMSVSLRIPYAIVVDGSSEKRTAGISFPNATVSTPGAMTGPDKKKLDGVATGATADSAITTEEIEGLFD